MILCNVKFRVYCLYVCFVSCARVRRRTEFEILSTPIKKKGKFVNNSKHRILYPRSANKQTITAPETTADSTNPRTAEEEAETNQQALTITLTRDTRKCLLNSSSGSHQASQRAAMSFFRGE